MAPAVALKEARRAPPNDPAGHPTSRPETRRRPFGNVLSPSLSATCGDNHRGAGRRAGLVQRVVQSRPRNLREYPGASNQWEGPDAARTASGPGMGGTGFEPVTSTV